MKAIILARVSTEEQITDGQSIPAQLGRAREYAIRKELEIKTEYQFDESSTKDRRSKFEEVINEIRKSKKPIALIVETVDRLQRSFKESVMLDEFRKEGKLELHFIRENLIIHQDSNSSEIQRWDLAVFVAKSYVLQISDNVKRTFERKIKNGELIGKVPIGYLNEEDGQGVKIAIHDLFRAPMIKKIFDLYSTGTYSMERIAQAMKKQGLKSHTIAQNSLKVRQIEYILKNPFYYGQQAYKGELYPHKYEPIISYELFVKCRDVRKSYNSTPKKHSSKPFIFEGLITCHRCGCRITPEFKKSKYVYYHCTNSKKNCEKVYINQNELLKPIKEVFDKIKLPKSKIDEIVATLKKNEHAKNDFHKEQLNELKSESDKINNRMSVMYEDRLDGRITTDMYDKNLAKYKERQILIMEKMKQYTRANHNYYITANVVLTVISQAEEIFESSEVPEKTLFINFLFQNLELDGKKLLYKLKTPFDGVLIANTTSNWGD